MQVFAVECKILFHQELGYRPWSRCSQTLSHNVFVSEISHGRNIMAKRSRNFRIQKNYCCLTTECRIPVGIVIQEALLVESITECWAHTSLEFPNGIEVGGGNEEQPSLAETFKVVGMGNIELC